MRPLCYFDLVAIRRTPPRKTTAGLVALPSGDAVCFADWHRPRLTQVTKTFRQVLGTHTRAQPIVGRSTRIAIAVSNRMTPDRYGENELKGPHT